MKPYIEVREEINKIRRNDELVFRCAINHLMAVGINNLTKESVDATCAEIMKEDDSRQIMTNEFKCDILKTAYELAQYDIMYILGYIQQEVDYDFGSDKLSYTRLEDIAYDTLDYAFSDACDVVQTADAINTDVDDLKALGFAWVADLIEEQHTEEE